MAFSRTGAVRAIIALGIVMAAPNALAADIVLQCVPYARIVSGIDIRGDALTWWSQAEGRYDRGASPRKGAVMAFAPVGPMTLGHVAVVSKVLNDREVLIRHANWSTPGAIEEDVRVIDVSDAGDWSAVKVWYSPGGQMGTRVNPVLGFIYAPRGRLNTFDPDRDAPKARWARLTPAPAMENASARVALASSSATARFRRLELNTAALLGDSAPALSRHHTRMPDRTLADIIADVKKGARIG
jgi:CHAP domain